MVSKLSRRSFVLLTGSVSVAASTAGAGSYALFRDSESATGGVAAASDFSEDAVRINAGGPEYTTPDGRTFAADQYATGGATFTKNDAIANTQADTLYQSERYDDADGFGYQIPVSNGTYDVRLHFAEIYWGGDGNGGGSGTRVFDLDIEGQSGLTDYDIFDTAGGHDVAVVETAQGVSVTDGQLSITTTTSNDNAKFSAIEVLPVSGYQQVDTTPSGSATYDAANLVVEAAGADVWQNDDEYGALYRSGISGNFTATVTVESQERVHPWSKAGIMVANDITAAGASAGDVFMAVTPDNGYQALYDSDGDGYVDSSPDDGSTSQYPSQLRVVKRGNRFRCAYSTDGGQSFTRIANVRVPEANNTQDVGLAVTSHEQGTTSRVEFADFTVG